MEIEQLSISPKEVDLPRGKQKRWQMESPWRVNQVILLGNELEGENFG